MAQSRVAILLDSSGSMGSIRQEAIDAFNKQVEVIQKDSDELPTKVSLVTFGNKANDPTIWNRRVSKLKPLTKEDYSPNGMTALYDAMGLTIDKLSQLPEANDPETAFQVVVISDGQENNSKEYTADFIKKRVKELEDTERWSFSYIGANQDMLKVSKDLGIDLKSTFAFDATSRGTQVMTNTYAAAATEYRSKLKKGFDKAKMDFNELGNVQSMHGLQDLMTDSLDKDKS